MNEFSHIHHMALSNHKPSISSYVMYTYICMAATVKYMYVPGCDSLSITGIHADEIWSLLICICNMYNDNEHTTITGLMKFKLIQLWYIYNYMVTGIKFNFQIFISYIHIPKILLPRHPPPPPPSRHQQQQNENGKK